MKKYFLTLLAITIWLFSFSKQTLAEEFDVPAEHAIAVEVSTGKVLYEKKAQTTAPIASITKLLTVYLVYEAIQEGKISLDTRVDISEYAYQLTASTVSNVNLDARNYSVQELLNAALIVSANSAAIALAEKIAGSEPAFVDLMKAKLTEWGFSDFKIVNASGLNNSYLEGNLYPGTSKEDENQLSALMIATIARRLILDFPQVLDITSQYSLNFDGYPYYSTNQMLRQGTHARAGVDGLKTGTTDKAGSSFVASTKQNNMRIITVVLDAKDGKENPDNRFIATNELMEFVYQNFHLQAVVEKDSPYKSSSMAVFNGQDHRSQAVADKNLNAVVRVGSEKSVSAKFTPIDGPLEAPISKAQSHGKLTLIDKDLIGSGYLGPQPSVDMVAAKTIPQANWPFSWWNHFVRYVNENL